MNAHRLSLRFRAGQLPQDPPDGWTLRRMFGVTGSYQVFVVAQLPEAEQIARRQTTLNIPHDDELSLRVVESGLNRFFQAAWLRMPDCTHLRVTITDFAGQMRRFIGGAVIDDQQFKSPGQLGQYFEKIIHLPRQVTFGITDR